MVEEYVKNIDRHIFIFFILAVSAFVVILFLIEYVCSLFAPNDKELPNQIASVLILAFLFFYFTKLMINVAKKITKKIISAAPVLIICAMMLAAISYIYLGFVGISHFIGDGYAVLAMTVILMLRINFTIPIAVFFGALHGLGWHWVASLAVALPGVALFSVFGIVGLLPIIKKISLRR